MVICIQRTPLLMSFTYKTRQRHTCTMFVAATIRALITHAFTYWLQQQDFLRCERRRSGIVGGVMMPCTAVFVGGTVYSRKRNLVNKHNEDTTRPRESCWK